MYVCYYSIISLHLYATYHYIITIPNHHTPNASERVTNPGFPALLQTSPTIVGIIQHVRKLRSKAPPGVTRVHDIWNTDENG